MRKLSLLLLFALILGALSLPITTAQEEMPAVEWVCPDDVKGGQLKIFNWADYFADQTVPRFAELCDADVTVNTYASNEEMISVLRENAAQYDLVFPTGYAVQILVGEGLASELNLERIPNRANLYEVWQSPDYDPDNVHSIPYQWGTVGIAYNTTLVDEPITSWEEFFNYEGRVVWLDDARAMLGVALKLLGYDPNSTDEAQISEAVDYLLAQNRDENGRSNIAEVTFINARNLMLREEVDAAIGYSGDMMRLNVDCECEDFAYILPSEGPQVWADNMLVPTAAPNPLLAHAFIDYILDPVVGAELSNFVAYATPNEAAQPFTDEAMRENPSVYPSQEVIETGFSALYLGEAETLYSEAWSRFLAKLAQ
jgi:spermidine/putrescine transport system substrate-binding protein